MSSNLVPWMIISWIHDVYYGNMVDEYHIIYWTWVTCLISWTHDTVTSCVVTKTYHVSCVVTKAGLSCVCVCVQHNLRLMLVSLQLFKDTNVTWSHFWGPESHTNVRNHESVGDLLLVYRYTCTFGLGLRHKFPFTVTGLSYQDPICLFRFIKFIKTKFQRTPRLCRV